ncbi:MAG: DUF1599 domain-containing protein [Bacteroidota bacterium]
MNQTLKQYREVIMHCHELFENKTRDYGTSWRMLRPISIVDQIYIKASRIRQIQETGTQKIGDSIDSEFVGIVTYGIIALIQGGLSAETPVDLTLEAANTNYQTKAQHVEDLMMQKNHDYGEAWREMNQASFVDLILVKLLRIKQILANDGKTNVSEGIDANFADIINYAVFALINTNYLSN